MDPGLTVRPIAGVAATDVGRIVPVSPDQSVATDLAPSQAVTATAGVDPSRNDPARLLRNDVTREFIVDPAVREVIFRVVDVNSGRVVRQVPDEALLRLRAYTRAIENGETPNQAFSATDREV